MAQEYHEVVLRLGFDDKAIEVEIPGEIGPVSSVARYKRAALRGLAQEWREDSENLSAQDVIEFSSKLGEALFPPAIAQEIRQRFERHRRLRIIIQTPEVELMGHPWELAAAAFDSGSRSTLSDLEEISIVRRFAFPSEAPDPVEGPLRVRFAFGPDGNVHAGLDKLEDPADMIKQLSALPGLQVETTEVGVSLAGAIEHLDRAHVFHFTGHGELEDRGTNLLFGRGELERVGAEDVRLRFASTGLRMVVLCACYSGVAGTKTLYESWCRLGIGIVIAMQRKLSRENASSFALAFYEELSTSGDLDRAMCAGRIALRGNWGPLGEQSTPVVYLQHVAAKVASREESHWVSRRGAKPYVRRHPDEGVEIPLEEFDDGLFQQQTGYQERKPRSITPFVGPGALQVGPTVEQISWDPALKEAGHVDGELKEFVEAVREARRGDRPVTSMPDAGSEISQVRVALARLAHSATQVFVRTSLKDSIPITHLEWHEVRIAEEDPFRTRLREAIDACRRAQIAATSETLLGEQRLTSRLEELRRQLEADGGGIIDGATVEWLTDLFWHSVVCDSLLYPRVEELALQVSLLQGGRRRPIRRLEAAGVVVRTDLRELGQVTSRALVRGFNRDEPVKSPRRRFFSALGNLLHAEYGAWQAPRSPLLTAKIAAPVALTANFDLEFERGLASGGQPFHVAVPVYVGSAADVDEIHSADDLRWLVGRFESADERPSIESLAQPEHPWRWLSSLVTGDDEGCDLDGPLLVKLNGSPLHRIPFDSHSTNVPHELPELRSPSGSDEMTVRGNIADSARRRGTGGGDGAQIVIEHALALGEYDFLQVTRMSQWSFDAGSPSEQGDGLPRWLCAQLTHARRYWILLGQRYADWNTKTQVFTFLTHDGPHPRPPEYHRGCAIALNFDQDRIRFLDWLGITRVRGSYDNFTATLEDMIDRRRRISS